MSQKIQRYGAQHQSSAWRNYFLRGKSGLHNCIQWRMNLRRSVLKMWFKFLSASLDSSQRFLCQVCEWSQGANQVNKSPLTMWVKLNFIIISPILLKLVLNLISLPSVGKFHCAGKFIFVRNHIRDFSTNLARIKKFLNNGMKV